MALHLAENGCYGIKIHPKKLGEEIIAEDLKTTLSQFGVVKELQLPHKHLAFAYYEQYEEARCCLDSLKCSQDYQGWPGWPKQTTADEKCKNGMNKSPYREDAKATNTRISLEGSEGSTVDKSSPVEESKRKAFSKKSGDKVMFDLCDDDVTSIITAELPDDTDTENKAKNPLPNDKKNVNTLKKVIEEINNLNLGNKLFKNNEMRKSDNSKKGEHDKEGFNNRGNRGNREEKKRKDESNRDSRKECLNKNKSKIEMTNSKKDCSVEDMKEKNGNEEDGEEDSRSNVETLKMKSYKECTREDTNGTITHRERRRVETQRTGQHRDKKMINRSRSEYRKGNVENDKNGKVRKYRNHSLDKTDTKKIKLDKDLEVNKKKREKNNESQNRITRNSLQKSIEIVQVTNSTKSDENNNSFNDEVERKGKKDNDNKMCTLIPAMDAWLSGFIKYKRCLKIASYAVVLNLPINVTQGMVYDLCKSFVNVVNIDLKFAEKVYFPPHAYVFTLSKEDSRTLKVALEGKTLRNKVLHVKTDEELEK